MKNVYSVLLVMVLVALLGGCKVSSEEWKFATDVCEDEGGVDHYDNPIQLSNFGMGNAHCNNGVVVNGIDWVNNEKARRKNKTPVDNS